MPYLGDINDVLSANSALAASMDPREIRRAQRLLSPAYNEARRQRMIGDVARQRLPLRQRVPRRTSAVPVPGTMSDPYGIGASTYIGPTPTPISSYMQPSPVSSYMNTSPLSGYLNTSPTSSYMSPFAARSWF